MLLFSCQFSPVYKSNNLSVKLCSINVEQERASAELYEITFKNELKSILCNIRGSQTNYDLKWSITKNFRELIKSESNTARRYEETLSINFTIYDRGKEVTIYTDTVHSKGAYNILEDEIISTLSSRKSVESEIAIIAAKLTLDKIHLFMFKDENTKF